MSMNLKTQRSIRGLYEMTDSGIASVESSKYYNKDLAPTKIDQRIWNTYNVVALWGAMSISMPVYMMAASLMALGLTWWQALINIALGNLIVLIPMQLNSHAGTKYGIPYPVFARLSFGIKGAYVAAVARGLIGAGWFGIQGWLGGEALNLILMSSGVNFPGQKWITFLSFMALNVFITHKGMNIIKHMQAWTVPLLVMVSLGLVVWAYTSSTALGKGIADIFDMPVGNKPEHFWPVFLKCLTANIAYWATLALNIPDFSRYAKSQKAQFRGQLLGLPTSMVMFAFVGLFVTGATKIIFGEYIWDPVQVIERINTPIASILGALAIMIATLNVNISANIVSTSNDTSNLFPKLISFKRATIIVGVLGVAIMPWKLLATSSSYIYGWLGTYALFLGPMAGIFIADYYFHRKKLVDEASLFSGSEGRYWYTNGFNKKAFYTWGLAAVLPLLGLFVPGLSFVADSGWIIGLVLAMVIYSWLMKSDNVSIVTPEENEKITEFVNPEKTLEIVS